MSDDVKNEMLPCTKCGKPTDDVCHVCGDPLHMVCGYLAFDNHSNGIVTGHKYCLKFRSGTPTKKASTKNIPKWYIEPYKPETIKLFDAQDNLLCVCNNEVEYYRARLEVIKLQMEGTYILREDGTRVELNKYGNPIEPTDIYKEHGDEAEALLIQQTNARYMNSSYGE